MADIQTYLDYILSKTYGGEVRQAIVDAINQCYIDASAGVTPVITTSPITGGTRITITVGSSSTNVDVMNGTATDEQVAEWLDDHPEATTSVADGSISTAKLADGAVTADKLSQDAKTFIEEHGISSYLDSDTGELYTIEQETLYNDKSEDSPIYDINDYVDIRANAQYRTYDENQNVIATAWGAWAKSTAPSTPAVRYVQAVKNGTATNVTAVKKVYTTTEKLTLPSVNEDVGVESVYTSRSFVWNGEIEEVDDSEIDFSKPMHLSRNVAYNDYIKFMNAFGGVISFTPTSWTTDFVVPETVKKMTFQCYTGVTLNYYKKAEQPLTMPKLNLVRDNFSADALDYLADVLGTEDAGGYDDLRTDRELVWSDEFSGKELDLSKWQYEATTYRRAYLRRINEHPNINAFTANGELILRILRDNPVSSREWSGAILHSTCKFQFLYGRIEAKIKFNTRGAYATLWLFGQNGMEYVTDYVPDNPPTFNRGFGWPRCGEVDIAESNGGSVSCGIHYEDANGEHATLSGATNYAPTSTDAYHIYALEWTPTSMTVYLDGQVVKTLDTTALTVNGFNPTNNPMHIVLSHLEGGAGVGYAPPETTNKMDVKIAWVRVYTPEGVENVDPLSIVIDSLSENTIVEKNVGDEWTPTLAVTPSEVVNRTCVWTSSNPTVLTVCPDGGYVKCLDAGYSTITCTMYNGVQASIIVHVSES